MSNENAPTPGSGSALAKTLKSFRKACARYAAGKAASMLHRAFGARTRETFAIFLYHRCVPRVAGLARPSMNVRPQRLRSQLVGLRRRGYTAWPLAQVLDFHRRGKPIAPKTFVITFDDGFESVYNHAWPVLRELKMPATVFIATAFLDAQDPFPFDRWARQNRERLSPETYRPLSAAQCKEMASGGLIELGAHTHTHADFRGEPSELWHDLEVCVSALQARFGVRSVPFAFPFGKSRLGYVDEALIDAARFSGVTCGLTTDGRTVTLDDDPFGWGRFNVYDFDTPNVLAAKCEGWCDWAARRLTNVSSSRLPEAGKRPGRALLDEVGSPR